MSKDEERNIDINTVDQAVHDAIRKYGEIGMIVDMMFWSHVIGLLQKKYGFKLEERKKCRYP